MKHNLTLAALALLALPLWADENPETIPGNDNPEPAGFVTNLLNNAIEKGMATSEKNTKGEQLEYGRNITKYVSAPKFGGYVISSYKYSSQDGKNNGDGFYFRNVRMYVDGTVLRDFKYRIQLECSGSIHLKDAFLEWGHWKEFRVKAGQFKRIFTFENPYNPWDTGMGDYTQLVKKLAGMGDYCGEVSSAGGRDIGLQLQGDVLPVSKDKHTLFHYQVGVFNGQGINSKDVNGKKDWMGSVQVQPVKDLYIGLFGWKGHYTNGVTVERNRWALGAKYEHNGWSARAEYAHNTGHKISDYVAVTNGNITNYVLSDKAGNGRADAWYATVGVPCTKWLKVFAKYDCYRDDATMGSSRTMYSLCPNFQLHKNLMFQVQYNYVHDKTATDRNYHELWAEAYIRF